MQRVSKQTLGSLTLRLLPLIDQQQWNVQTQERNCCLLQLEPRMYTASQLYQWRLTEVVPEGEKWTDWRFREEAGPSCVNSCSLLWKRSTFSPCWMWLLSLSVWEHIVTRKFTQAIAHIEQLKFTHIFKIFSVKPSVRKGKQTEEWTFYSNIEMTWKPVCGGSNAKIEWHAVTSWPICWVM